MIRLKGRYAIVVVFIIMAFIGLSEGKASAASEEINDNDPNIAYTGFTYITNDTKYNLIQNDFHQSNTAGDYVEFSFTGTSIAWIGMKNFDHGYADVYIDNVKDATVDTYAETGNETIILPRYKQVLYQKTGLSAGSHTIKIVVTNEKNPESSGIYQDVDAFRVATESVLGTNFFNQSYTGSRNDITVNAGYEFTPTQDINVTGLGRSVNGTMVHDHDIMIWKVSDASLVAQTRVTPASPSDALGNKMERLAAPVPLEANTAYRIVSTEIRGGDPWMDLASVNNHQSVAAVTRGVSGSVGAYPNLNWGTAEQGYGSATFSYVTTGPFNFARTVRDVDAVTVSSSLDSRDGNQLSYNKVYLVDGNRNSTSDSMGWTSNNNLTADHTEYVEIDLGAVNRVTTVDLYPRNNWASIGAYFPIDFTIAVSTDRVNWSTVVTQSNYLQPGNTVQRFTFSETDARYVRLTMTKLRPSGGDYRAQLAEIEVYNLNSPNTAPEPKAAPALRSVAVGMLIDEDYPSLSSVLQAWDYDLSLVDAKVASDGNGYMRLTRTSDANPLTATRRFVPVTAGKVTWEYSFSESAVNADGLLFQLRGGSVPAVSIATCGGSLCYESFTGSLTAMQTFNADEVYGIKVVADLAQQKADIYINGQLKASQVPFANNVPRLDNLYFKQATPLSSKMYLYLTKVYTGYTVYEKFLTANSSVIPSDWTTNAAGGFVSLESMDSGRRPDTRSLILKDIRNTGTVQARKTFAPQSGNATTHSVVFAYKFMQRVKKDGFYMQLMEGASAAVKLTTDAGNIGYVNSGGTVVTLWSNYKPNVWYDVKIVANLAAHTADIYINGKLKASGVAFNQTVNSVDAIDFANADPAIIGSLYLDDIYLYDKLPEPANYVPAPVPVSHSYTVGMQAFSFWREGENSWDVTRNNNFRKPIIGFYNEGDPEVADWEIKYMVEHGVDFVQFGWLGPNLDWKSSSNPIKDSVLSSYAMDDGYFNAKYSHDLKFSFLWINASGLTMDYMNGNYESYFKDIVFPYWMEHYFKDDRYMKMDNKPILSIFSINDLVNDFGGNDRYVKTNIIDWIRQQFINEGFAGVILLGSSNFSGNLAEAQRAKNIGLDYLFAYASGTFYKSSDVNGGLISQRDIAASAGMNLIASPSVNWSSEPWDGKPEYRPYDAIQRDPAIYKNDLIWVRDSFMPSLPNDPISRGMILLDNWNEYGEGHMLMPTVGNGFGYLDALRDVFTTGGTHTDVVPSEEQRARIDTLYPHGEW